jgi:hypothetical protein
VTIEGLTITHGKADGSAPGIPSYGGGILNFGNLTLREVVVSDNQAVGDANKNPLGRGPGNAFGGGVYNGFTIDPDGMVHLGNLTVEDHSIFTRNQALGPDNPTSTVTNARFPGSALGGGLANEGVATVRGDSQFTSNLAQGGNSWHGVFNGGFAGVGGGGAIASVGISVHAQLEVGSLEEVSGSSFSDNQAVGGNGNSSASLPGFGIGGAIVSHRFQNGADLTVSDSTFDHNQAIGGNNNQLTSANPGFPPNIADGGGILSSGRKTGSS